MKHCPHCGKEVRVDQDLCLNCGRYINRTNTQFTDKKTISFLLCLFGGFFGLHYFYEGNYKKGILYLLTAGIFMFGYIIDVFKYGIRLLKKDAGNSAKNYDINVEFKECSVQNPYVNAVPYYIYQDAYTTRKQKNTPKDYVVFDTETTGLEPEIDKVIEISAIKYINNQRVDTFSCLVDPKVKIDPFITELTGIKQSDLNGKQTIDKVLPLFFDFIGDLTLIAHNAPYDIKMLACECYRSNLSLCDNKIIDTVTLAKKIIPKEKIKDYKLETLKQYFGLNNRSHRALDDCETCAYIYQLYLKAGKSKSILIIDEETGEVLN